MKKKIITIKNIKSGVGEGRGGEEETETRGTIHNIGQNKMLLSQQNPYGL